MTITGIFVAGLGGRHRYSLLSGADLSIHTRRKCFRAWRGGENQRLGGGLQARQHRRLSGQVHAKYRGCRLEHLGRQRFVAAKQRQRDHASSRHEYGGDAHSRARRGSFYPDGTVIRVVVRPKMKLNSDGSCRPLCYGPEHRSALKTTGAATAGKNFFLIFPHLYGPEKALFRQDVETRRGREGTVAGLVAPLLRRRQRRCRFWPSCCSCWLDYYRRTRRDDLLFFRLSHRELRGLDGIEGVHCLPAGRRSDVKRKNI